MGSAAPTRADCDEQLSPRQMTSTAETAIQPVTDGAEPNNSLGSLDLRADPDAQATVTDFLDFTEYLPSDMIRSLTLVGKLNQTYSDSSANVHALTSKWGQLPSMPPEERPTPAQLRSEISENLSQAVGSRIYAHAEAVRMAENVNRHYNRAKTILAKLQTMLENYPPPEEQRSPVAANKSPQVARAPKITLRLENQKVRRPRVPRITVPGEVLAPYDLNYETLSSESETSSGEEEEDGTPHPSRPYMATQPRIKLVKTPKTPKVFKTPKSGTSVPYPNMPGPGISSTTALAQLQPPPEDAVLGSPDAPWLQLTVYELAKLRKRMKKNAAWVPSDTMIARELKTLGRGVEAYKAAKQTAKEEGNDFEDGIPTPVLDAETGVERMPPGALSMETINAEEKKPKNRRVKKKPKEPKDSERDQLAKLAAEEAEESARKMADLARTIYPASHPPMQDQAARSTPKAKSRKRKRDSVTEAEAEKPEMMEPSSQRPPSKRTKTETPVPPPRLTPSTTVAQETPGPQPQLTPGGTAVAPHSTTPIPLPVPGQDQRSATSPVPSPGDATAPNAVTMTVPVKPAAEGSTPRPVLSRKKSATPILPPVRETRKTLAARKQEQQQQQNDEPAPSSRPVTPAPRTPMPDLEAQSVAPTTTRRPASRGKAASQEPHPSLAADRPRRTSTARNTPAPERQQEPTSRPASRRAKRPAPGVISRTNSGGSSAVGKRKAAPRKKSARGPSKKAAGGGVGDVLEVEVDDEGNVIDADEPKYCHCNRVSFGTMIQCDNVDVSSSTWGQCG